MDESQIDKKTLNNEEQIIQKDNSLELNIDNYEGPLDLLLDLAKPKKLI